MLVSQIGVEGGLVQSLIVLSESWRNCPNRNSFLTSLAADLFGMIFL